MGSRYVHARYTYGKETTTVTDLRRHLEEDLLEGENMI